LLNKSKTWINQEFKGKKKGTKWEAILDFSQPDDLVNWIANQS
jgi:hypothetical protein